MRQFEKIKFTKIVFFYVIYFVLISSVRAGDLWVGVNWENDFIVRKDSGYTNGGALSWGYGPFDSSTKKPLPVWLDSLFVCLPGMSGVDKKHALSYRISQFMFTPEDIEATELIVNDRPYVGMLLWQINFQGYSARESSRYSLTAGFVGPLAGVEPVQKITHGLIGKKTPSGWNNQIANELVFAVSAERLWRVKAGNINDTFEYDLLGISAADLGTLRSELGGGVTLRAGRGLSRSFHAVSIISGRNFNPLVGKTKNEWHLFINLYARYLFNDIVFDGNTYRNSHSVTLKHEQLRYAIGVSYHANWWGMVFSIQDGSQLFEERNENELFSSISLVYLN